MVLCTLINISLDISSNIAWFVLKNSLYGTYYFISYLNYTPPKLTQHEINVIELSEEINQLNIHIKQIEKLALKETDLKIDDEFENDFEIIN